MTQSTHPADLSKSDAVIDKYEALRKALAAGPTPGPRRAVSEAREEWTCHSDDAVHSSWQPIVQEDGSAIALVVDANDEFEDRASFDADVQLIAACDPATLTSLLADADRARELEADARRYRWLRDGDAAAPQNLTWPVAFLRLPGGEIVKECLYGEKLDAAIDRAQGETR